MNLTKTLPLALLSVVLAMPFTGCQSTCPASSAKQSVPNSEQTLAQAAERNWKLDKWLSTNGVSRLPGPITFRIDKNNRISGMSGVNRYMGSPRYTAEGKLDLTQGMAGTMMAGIPDAMERERLYLGDLKRVNEARLENGRLVFLGDDVRLEFVEESAK